MAIQLHRESSRFAQNAFSNVFSLQNGHYNIAIARMLIAASLWLTLDNVSNPNEWDHLMASLGDQAWRPKGLAKIFFADGPASQGQVLLITGIAKISIITMALGLFSRVSTMVAALSMALLVATYWSPYEYWSHASNVQLLTALAFMFGRSGDRLSLDWLIRKRLGLSDPFQKYNGSYWWPVLLAELATHLFMFGAFYSKFTIGDGIWWALSDNLRNSLAISWGVYRFDPPAIVFAIAATPFLYKLAGVLQLCAQFSTIFAIFLTRLPVLRLIVGGVFFFMEIMGLTHLFRFWHPFWVPLCLLSVDWEWFAKKARQRMTNRTKSEKNKYQLPVAFAFADGRVSPLRTLDRISFVILSAPKAVFRVLLAYTKKDTTRVQLGIYPVLVFIFSFTFFSYYASSIVFKLGEKHLNYPFSSMAFYAENRDIPPFDEPGYFPIYRGFFILSEQTESGPVELDLAEIPSDQAEPLKLLYASESTMRQRIDAIRNRYVGTRWRFKDGSLRQVGELVAIRTYSQIVAVPPAPESPLPLTELHSGLLAVEDEKGFRGVAARLEWDEERDQYKIELDPWGWGQPEFTILARKNVREDPMVSTPQPMVGEWEGSAFYIKNTRETDSSFTYSIVKVVDPILGVEEFYSGPENFQKYR